MIILHFHRALSVSKITPGHYNLESLAKEINGVFAKYSYKLETQIKSTCWPACNQKFWVKTDRTWSRFSRFAWYWAEVEPYNIRKKAYNSNDIFYSLWFDRHRTESVQCQKVRCFSPVWCEREALWKGELPGFSATGFARLLYRRVYKQHHH